jgi:hypothetical protein
MVLLISKCKNKDVGIFFFYFFLEFVVSATPESSASPPLRWRRRETISDSYSFGEMTSLMELLQDSLTKAEGNGTANVVVVLSCKNAIERTRMAKLERIMWIPGGPV